MCEEHVTHFLTHIELNMHHPIYKSTSYYSQELSYHLALPIKRPAGLKLLDCFFHLYLFLPPPHKYKQKNSDLAMQD